ncbi:MAG: topoisomerase C-terminal repeat-containing protein, partial [Chloroflexota bacterium]
NEGKTALLSGFVSKAGKPFSAALSLDGGKLTFTFAPRRARGSAKGGASDTTGSRARQRTRRRARPSRGKRENK